MAPSDLLLGAVTGSGPHKRHEYQSLDQTSPMPRQRQIRDAWDEAVPPVRAEQATMTCHLKKVCAYDEGATATRSPLRHVWSGAGSPGWRNLQVGRPTAVRHRIRTKVPCLGD